MKKDDLFQSLTYVVLVLYVNCLILLLPLSETSKVILLILYNFVCLSAALLARQESPDTLSTTRRPGGLNRLASLVAAEKRIAARGKTTTSNLEPDWKLTTQCDCPWDRPCSCADRRNNV